MPSSDSTSTAPATAAHEASRIPADYEWKYHSGQENDHICSCKACYCGAAVPHAGDLCDRCSNAH
ncbi:hypothetical protein B0T21DRAFT_278192 [Apiosordaria backusii]|uniref:Metallothionein n=1 Tax=Apiosordaria backusii TaxID=314023 RepID=A0AA40EZG5_9PEZI|nr:hypothetical protein B0T21DRAFT_278192 [Apiosordaria backusii]